MQNVKPALVFRGKGNVFNEEKQKYDNRVDVYFQQNAWMDVEINMQWTNNTLIPGIGDDKKKKFYLQIMLVSNRARSFMKYAEIR